MLHQVLILLLHILHFSEAGLPIYLQSETNVRKFLFDTKNYNSAMRPVNSTDSLTVQLNMDLRQILDFEERNQVLHSLMWHHWEWVDQRLKWTPSAYGGIETIYVKKERLWIPDIIIYNDLREEAREVDDYGIMVSYNGSVVWNFPILMKSACKFAVNYYPFDQQVCPIMFGSSAYDVKHLNIVNSSSKGDFISFTRNGEFELKDILVRKSERKYNCCPYPFAVVTYFIVIQRKSLFILYNIVLPCIVVMFAVLMGFYLPPDSGEKVSVGMISMVAIFVFLLLLEQWLPPQSDEIPLINIFFILIICLTTVSLCITIVIMNIYYRGQHGNKFPGYLESFLFNGLARILRLRHMIHTMEEENQRITECHKDKKDEYMRKVVRKTNLLSKFKKFANTLDEDDDDEDEEADKVCEIEQIPTVNPKTLVRRPFSRLRIEAVLPAKKSKSTEEGAHEEIIEDRLHKDLGALIKSVSGKVCTFEDLQFTKEASNLTEARWKIAAIIVDRFFYVLFFVIILVVCCSTLLVFPDYDLSEKQLSDIIVYY